MKLLPALILALSLIVFSCGRGSDSAPTSVPLTPTADTLWEAQPSPEWRLVEISGWRSQAGFSLKLPPGWEFIELRGIDSYVGEIVGDGVRLWFDYGGFSPTLDPDDDPEHDYFVFFERIGGLEAKLVRPKDSTEGLTGVYFPRFPSPALTVAGSDLNLEQQKIAFAIFRSARHLGGLTQIQVTFDPPPPVFELGGEIPPRLIIDLVESGMRYLVSSKDFKKESVYSGGTRLLPTGQYVSWLGPGTYVVDIQPSGDFISDDLPYTFSIETGETVYVEIGIDTNIR